MPACKCRKQTLCKKIVQNKFVRKIYIKFIKMGADKMKKCGEILINLKKKNKKSRTYTFHCTFCETSWDQMKKFSMHLEELHLKSFEEESKDIPIIYEPEIKIETEDKMLQTQNKMLSTEIAKDDPLETEAVLTNCSADNEKLSEIQIKDEDEDLDDNEMDIKIEEVNESCSDDNDDDYKPLKDDESTSCDERIYDSAENDSEIKDRPKQPRKCKAKLKRQKANKDFQYLAIDSEEKDLNIALLEAFEKKPFLWDIKEKCRNDAICQKGYEAVATEVNDKFDTQITWDFAKNRINNMRFECSYEIEKQHNGENYQLPWYYDCMKYLHQNIITLTKDRIKKKRFKNINEKDLPIFIELYKKYEDLWQVNSVFFGITTKRDEIYNKMVEELKLNWNIDITLDRLRNHIQYINRLYSKDKEIQLKCELAKSDFSPTSKFYKDLTFLSDCQGPFKCSHCNEVIKKYENYHIHVAQHTNSRPFKCPLCELAFKKFDTCISHVKRHLSENSHRCDICGKGYPKKSELDRHITYHTGEKPFLCQICGTGFRTSRDHDNHVRRHENRFRYECQICKMGFNHMHTLNDHVKSHLNVRDILCNICGKGFTATRYLNNHKLIHEDKKHYKCHVCGKEFAQGAGLRAHRKLHKPYSATIQPSNKESTQRYLCNICKKSYKSKCTLQYHQYSHNPGSGTFACTINDCKRTFKNPKRLSDHKRRYHLNTENYICEYCGYHTRIRCNLTVHRRKHTGEKPYCCEYCANGFSSSYQLNIHREIHKAERAHYCIACGESFIDSKALYHHEALHASDNKKYSCKLCDKTYKQSAGLSQHLRWHRKQQERCTDIIKIVE